MAKHPLRFGEVVKPASNPVADRIEMQKKGWHFVTRHWITYTFKNQLLMKDHVLAAPAEREAYGDPTVWIKVPLDDELRVDLGITGKMCYCSSLPHSRCDFCTGLRNPALALADSEEGKAALKMARTWAVNNKRTCYVAWNNYTGTLSQVDRCDKNTVLWIANPDGTFEEGKITA